jgi:hypothetical protein
MRASRKFHREFVDFIPREMEADTLYIAMEFATASHKCFCGCGAEVVTPLSPAGWQLYFDGEAVSLTPSVGSWGLPCKSHYWIRRDTVEWAGMMSADEIERVRARDHYAVQQHFGAAPRPAAPAPAQPAPKGAPKRKGILDWITSLWR